jgi:putative ABC transport system permease protein
MLKIIASKMLHNRTHTLFLFGSAVLFTALICSIPLFTLGILQRMLIRDLERFQTETSLNPGNLSVTRSFWQPEKPPAELYAEIDKFVGRQFKSGIGVPLLYKSRIVSLLGFTMIRDTGTGKKDSVNPFVDVTAIEGMDEHITLTAGRLPSGELTNGVLEVMVSRDCLIHKGLLLNEEYLYDNPYKELKEPFTRIRITGVFDPSREQPEFWQKDPFEYRGSLFIPFDQFQRDFIVKDASHLYSAVWYYALDYHRMKASKLYSLIMFYSGNAVKLGDMGSELKLASEQVIVQYGERLKYLIVILLFLYTPILILLGFLIYMISQLIVDSERNNISTMKYRGASRKQIFKLHLFESLILAGAAFVLGPWVGFLFCGVLGSANGFLEFVQRSPLPLEINLLTFVFALIGGLFFIMTMMIPVLRATSVSIVQLKQGKGRKRSVQPFWKRFFLDAVLLAVSLYGYFSYRMRTAAGGTGVPVDPLLFALSTLFILALGLVALRIIPLLIRLLFKAGEKIWPAPIYSALLQVIRSGGKEDFIILFLIFCLALGIFDSTAAQTLTRNMEERVRYRNGGTMVFELFWNTARGNKALEDQYKLARLGADSDMSLVDSGRKKLFEPPFEPYMKLPGVRLATKVAQGPVTVILPGQRVVNINYMGIVPEEFGRTAWVRNDLFPIHWFHYLNAIAGTPQGALISENLRQTFDLKFGDIVTMKWDEKNTLNVIILGTFKYWPSWFPVDKEGKDQFLMVTNLNYLFGFTGVKPYNVWIDRDPSVPLKELYTEIREQKLPVVKVIDTAGDVSRQKEDPVLQGINGVFSLGFIICIIICATGFFLYWLFSLKERTLQLGILRAMGLSQREITIMLLTEQFILIGTSFTAGILTGGLASRLFVPLLQLADAATLQIPPFQVFVEPADIIRLLVLCLVLFSAGALFFVRLIHTMQISRSLKMGED